MRHIPFIFIIGFFTLGAITSSCNKSDSSNMSAKYGDTTITAEGAIDVSEIPAMLDGKDSVHVKAKGEIKAVCKKKGCWMSMPVSDDENMMVRFLDYGFFVPMNSSGSNAIVEGVAYVDTVSVAERKHLAKDANKSQEEIDAITEPSVEYTFTASGVIIE